MTECQNPRREYNIPHTPPLYIPIYKDLAHVWRGSSFVKNGLSKLCQNLVMSRSTIEVDTLKRQWLERCHANTTTLPRIRQTHSAPEYARRSALTLGDMATMARLTHEQARMGCAYMVRHGVIRRTHRDHTEGDEAAIYEVMR